MRAVCVGGGALYLLRAGSLEMSPKRFFPSVPLVKLGTSFKKVCACVCGMRAYVVSP